MLAVIATGGKQYLVKTGDKLKVEKIAGEVGEIVSFDKVLLLANDDGSDLKIGSPEVTGAKVAAEVVRQARTRTLHVVKFKNKVRYKRSNGHRQYFTEVLVK